MLIAFLRVEVMANVGPLAQSGLDEAFRLAVGAGSVRTGEAVLDAELEAGGAEVAGAIAGADSQERDHELAPWLDYYNFTRPHGSLGYARPSAELLPRVQRLDRSQLALVPVPLVRSAIKRYSCATYGRAILLLLYS